MTTRAGITLALLLGMVTAGPRRARAKRHKPVGVMIVVDLTNGSVADARRARRIVSFIVRALPADTRPGMIYMKGRHAKLAGPRPVGRLLPELADVKAGAGTMDFDAALARAFALLNLFDTRAERVFVIRRKLPVSNRPVSSAEKDSKANITYFVLGTPPLVAPHVRTDDRVYWLHGKAVLASIKQAMRPIAPALGRVVTVPAWFKKSNPCPPHAVLQSRRAGAGGVAACARPDGTLHGRRTVWGPDGLEVCDAFYRNGKLDGERRRWSARGRVISSQHYRRGVRDGAHRVWFPSGRKRERGSYRAGQRHGLWLRWHRFGTLAARQHCDRGRPVGTWNTFYADGSRRTREHYRHGKLDGLYEHWGVTGKLVERGHYKHGLRAGKWEVRYEATSKLKQVGRYRSNQRDGEWRFYLSSGQLRRKEIYENGLIKETRWY